MRIPNILKDLLPAERLKPILDLANQDKIASVLKEVVEQIRGKGSDSGNASTQKSFPPKDIQQAIRQAKWWFDSLTHRFQSASVVPLKQALNGTGEIFSSKWIAAPASADMVTAVSMVHSGFCLAEGLSDSLNSKLRDQTGAQASLVTTNIESAIMLLSAWLSEKTIHSGTDLSQKNDSTQSDSFQRNPKPWAIARRECVRLPSDCDVVELLKSMNTSGVIEAGASNACQDSDFSKAIAQGAGGIFRVAALAGEVHSNSSNAIGHNHPVPTAVLAMTSMLQSFVVPATETVDATQPEKVSIVKTHLHQPPSVRALLDTGVDVVICVGNGWLGGPVCGIVVGKSEVISALQSIADRLGLKASTATQIGLSAAVDNCSNLDSWSDSPIGQIASNSIANLEHRAKRLAVQLEGVSTIESIRIELRCISVGPSLWESTKIDSFCLIIHPANRTANEWQKQLAKRAVPLECHVVDDQIVVVLRTINPADDQELVAALTEG
jgi:L-seryl-tRNA(Ser) seleniumtransferase